MPASVLSAVLAAAYLSGHPKSTSGTRALLAHHASLGLVHSEHPVNDQMNSPAVKCLSLPEAFQGEPSPCCTWEVGGTRLRMSPFPGLCPEDWGRCGHTA